MRKFIYAKFLYDIMEQELKLKPRWDKVCHEIEEHIKDPKYARALEEFIRATS